MSLPEPSAPKISPDGSCCPICHEPLHVPNRDDPETPSYLIDDAELRCGHHLHRSCLVEHALLNPIARQKCVVCGQRVLNNKGQFIVWVPNEGGYTGGIDIGDEIDREAFMRENPQEERKDAFLSFMAQMDFGIAETFLKGEDEGSLGEKLNPNVHYERGKMTAMHMAALNNDVEGIELLLKYGADKEFETADGQTALDLARDVDGREAVAALLRN